MEAFFAFLSLSSQMIHSFGHPTALVRNRAATHIAIFGDITEFRFNRENASSIGIETHANCLNSAGRFLTLGLSLVRIKH